MKIILEQDFGSIFGSRYNVYIRNRKRFRIKKTLFTSDFRIIDLVSEEVVGEIVNESFSMKIAAKITLPNGVFQMNQPEFNAMQYLCKKHDSDDVYKLFGFEGYGGGIYFNKTQIGQWNKNNLVFFDGDVFQIEVDYDVNVLLMVSMMVLIDQFRTSVKVGGTFGFDLGNFGEDLRKPQKHWKPKRKLKRNKS